MKRRKGIKDAALLASGSAIGQGLSLARTVVLARVLTKAEMGLAVLLQMMVFLFDMMSDLNIGTMLVQDPDGEAPSLQSTAHSIWALRAVAMAALMFFAAWPLSELFDAPNARWAFACLAMVPLIRGVAHTDPWRFQRYKKYLPSVSADVLSQFASTAVTLMLVWYLKNFTVMLWALVTQAVAYNVLTHIFSARKYHLGWDGPHLRRILHFGWPLLLNGLLMFGIMQGDRLILGAQRIFTHYTRADLATYSVAFTLAMTPSLLAAKVLSSLFLPRLAAVQASGQAFKVQYRKAVDVVGLLAGLGVLSFILISAEAVKFVYGERYRDAGTVVAWLGVMSSVRLLRSLTALAALARGDTRNSLISNVARVTGVGLAVVVALFGMNIVWIAIAGVIGEFVALATSVVAVRCRHDVSYRLYMPAFASMIIASLAAAGIRYLEGTQRNLVAAGAWWLMLSIAYVVAFAVISPEVRLLIRPMRETVGEKSTEALLSSGAAATRTQ